MLPVTTAGRNPSLRADSLAELLSWDDVEFVRCAYATLLGRESDPFGEAAYTDQMRRGDLKMEVLWQIRRSPEGRDKDPGIAGLDSELRHYRNATRPLGGSIDCAATEREGNSLTERRFAAIGNQMAAARLEYIGELSLLQRQLDLQAAGLDAARSESRSIADLISASQEQFNISASIAEEMESLKLQLSEPNIPTASIRKPQDRLSRDALRLYNRLVQGREF